MVDAFSIKTKWVAAVKGLRDSVEARLCQMRMDVGKEAATSYVGDNGECEQHVTVPGYFVAEWIAENWWPLLWEPRKSEDQGDHPDFKERHSLLAAQHGFALPFVIFTPTGEQISIYAGSRRSELAEVRFDKTTEALVSRNVVEQQLRTFVEDTLKHLSGFEGTPLHEAWASVTSTTDLDEVFFCKLIGSLGLSPYEEHPSIERALDSASSVLSPVQLSDLCATSLPHEVVRNAFISCRAQQAVAGAPAIDLSILADTPAPDDILAHPAFQTGYRGARKLRDKLAISEKDVDGANKIFKSLSLEDRVGVSSLPSGDTTIMGATKKCRNEAHIALVPGGPAARRFATARGAYLCWSSNDKEGRLITGAATRDQQASRAFAAELLIPRAYVKSHAGGNKLSFSQVSDLAERELVAFDTVKFQAQNAGIQLVH